MSQIERKTAKEGSEAESDELWRAENELKIRWKKRAKTIQTAPSRNGLDKRESRQMQA